MTLAGAAWPRPGEDVSGLTWNTPDWACRTAPPAPTISATMPHCPGASSSTFATKTPCRPCGHGTNVASPDALGRSVVVSTWKSSTFASGARTCPAAPSIIPNASRFRPTPEVGRGEHDPEAGRLARRRRGQRGVRLRDRRRRRRGGGRRVGKPPGEQAAATAASQTIDAAATAPRPKCMVTVELYRAVRRPDSSEGIAPAEAGEAAEVGVVGVDLRLVLHRDGGDVGVGHQDWRRRPRPPDSAGDASGGRRRG